MRELSPMAFTIEWVLLGLALTIAGALTVDIRHSGEIESWDVFEVALAPAIFLLAGLHVVLLVAAAKVVAQLVLRMPWTKLAFNVAQWMACAGAGALTFALLGSISQSRVPAMILAMIVVAAANLAALVGLFALLSGAAAARELLLPNELAWTVRQTMVTTTAGVGLTVAAVGHPAVLLLAVALPVLLHRAGRGYALARADLDRMHCQQAAARTLSAVLDPWEGASPFLAEVARCCSADAAELALSQGNSLNSHRYARADDGDRGTITTDVTLTAVLLAGELPALIASQPRRPTRWWSRWWRALQSPPPDGQALPLRTDEAALSAVRDAGWRDCLAVPVLIGETPAGVLAVYDRSGFADFDQAELGALKTLAREVAATVQRADLVEEIIGARRNAARIVQGSNDGIVAITEDGTVVTWNPAFTAMTGQQAAQMLGRGRLTRLDARGPNGLPVWLEDWADGRVLPDELNIRTLDGRRRWLSCSYARITRDGRTGPLLVVMARDVTELRRQRDLIAGQGRVLELIASDEPPLKCLSATARLIAVQIDGATSVLLPAEGEAPKLNVVFEYGERPDLVLPDGESLRACVHDVRLEEWEAAAAAEHPLMVDLVSGSRTRRCWLLPVLDHERHQLRCVLAIHPMDGGEPDGRTLDVLRTASHLAGVCLERHAARARLAHQASHDPLTGLPNRVLFLDRCNHALHVARRRDTYAVVLFVDLDRFKVINDSLGHDAGDRMLMAVAERLREAVRPSDTIARFGGDEFTILCEELPTAEDARILAERVLALFSAPFLLDGREVFETASVGIALGRAPQQPEDLVQQADAAMYRAKASGGNRLDFFDAALRRQALARLASYAGLRRAVVTGEIELHYQPTFALRDGAPVGLEALARWRHPTRGLLGPDAFIDLAEETGLIVPLGKQILTTALHQMPREPIAGSGPLRVSVNLSARQLMHPDLEATVSQALDEAGVAPGRLALEITESVLLTDSAAMRGVIAHLKQLGVDLSLDDFGTGHSSMDYLKFLPVDELKIEKRFVAGLLTDDRDRAIISAITHLAHDLGLRVVAEGVETPEQAERLRELGCDVGQGYYFGRPMPLEQVVDLTRTRR